MLMFLLDLNDTLPLSAFFPADAELRFGRRLITGRWF
jgi:hypothetical protein